MVVGGIDADQVHFAMEPGCEPIVLPLVPLVAATSRADVE